MTGLELMPLAFVPIVSVMMTSLFSVSALILTMVNPRRTPTEVDPAHLALAAFAFMIVGFLMFVLIYVSAPQLRHLAHAGL